MKAVNKAATGLALLGLLCVGAVCVFETHDDALTEEGLLETNASDLKQTVVTPHLETPLPSGASVLWCGTFQLAWNEACSLIGENLRLIDEPPMVGVLNKKSFTTEDIDQGSYVAVAGFVKDDIHGQIARHLEENFALWVGNAELLVKAEK
jgi:hypothetical protein